jgi:hypothetical protein
MKKVSPKTISAIFASCLFGFTAPAFATTTSQAIKLCQKNPSCHSRVGEHSVIFTINGQEAVECPKLSTGQCIVVRTNPHGFGNGQDNNAQQRGGGNTEGGGQVGGPG